MKTKSSNALVRRGKKLSPADTSKRMEVLLGQGDAAPAGFLSKVLRATSAAAESAPQSLQERRKVEVVASSGPRRAAPPRKQAADLAEPESSGPTQGQRTMSTKDAIGKRLLADAVKNQSYRRTLPHQERHDFEFRLRRIATSGVVRLFNSLTAAQSSGEKALTEGERTVTIDKAQEKKLVASRAAFFAAITQPGNDTSGPSSGYF